MKENTIKVLKTICKVQKDKCDIKHFQKPQEYCRSSKIGLFTNSMKKFESSTNIK